MNEHRKIGMTYYPNIELVEEGKSEPQKVEENVKKTIYRAALVIWMPRSEKPIPGIDIVVRYEEHLSMTMSGLDMGCYDVNGFFYSDKYRSISWESVKWWTYAKDLNPEEGTV